MDKCKTCKNNEQCKNKEMINVKKIIGVMSGKGGVGKSTMSSLIAQGLNQKGYKVGLVDADIMGPSIPRLLGIEGMKAGARDGKIIPVETKDGIKVISMNLLLEKETDPIIWRGILVSNMINQFFTDVNWGELDYLIIDLPPGTGDVPLTIMQNIPIDGMVLVTIPQNFISMIVAKSINMVRKMEKKVIGVVENMSYIKCPKCNEEIDIFTEGDIKKYVEGEVDVLERFPNDLNLYKTESLILEDLNEEFKEKVLNMVNKIDK